MTTAFARPWVFISLLFCLLLSACSSVPASTVTYDPQALAFDGERAFALEGEFVTAFTNRHSGTEKSQQAVAWLQEHLSELGLECAVDEWSVVNYSEPVNLRNLVCRLPGESDRELLIVAHHDQASMTVEGADNDGAGIAILLELAAVFAGEGTPRYTLTFAATDAEEYGMLGSLRYIQTHPNTEEIVAGISMDNLGRYYYDGMNMELVGQFRGYGPVWLARTAEAAASAADDLWVPRLRAPLDQLADQAAPISFMDQGPMVAAGVPALGFAAAVPAEYVDLHYDLWHDPRDTMEFQTPAALHQSGRVAEALVRQLLSMEAFPDESGPYLYFDASQQVLRGPALWAIFVGFVALFLVAGIFWGGGPLREKPKLWLQVSPHFLGFWLPLIASILLLYLFVEIGLLEEYYLYPATSKDPLLLEPYWPAIGLFVLAVGLLLIAGRSVVKRVSMLSQNASWAYYKGLAFIVIGVCGVWVLAVNPFSLFFFVPLLFWFLIGGRSGVGRAFDVVLFLVGGLAVYGLIYQFGFQVLRYDFGFFWFLMNLIATQTIGLGAVLVSTAIIAAGLTMVVRAPSVGRGPK